MATLVILNETTLPRLAWAALRRAPDLYVVAVAPWFPPLAQPLERLAAWLKAKRRAGDLYDFAPEFRRYVKNPQHLLLTDVFTATESWERGAFDLARWTAVAPDYARAAYHATDLHVASLYPLLYLLRRLTRNAPAGGARLWGAGAELLSLYCAFYGESPPFGAATHPTARGLANAAAAVAVAGYAFSWCVRRLRLRRPSTRRFRFGIDFNPGRDFVPCARLAESPDQILVVLRNRGPYYEAAWRGDPRAAASPACHRDEGVATPRDILGALFLLARDLTTIWRVGRRLPGALFFEIAMLVFRRLQMRALFRRYPVDCFWAWDDYNAEHVVRTQELRRIGAVSIGVMHAFPISCTHSPVWRHVDFDRYYVHGRIVAGIYADEWPAETRAVAVGCLGMDEERFAALSRPPPPPNDIAVFTNTFAPPARVAETTGALARAFPARRVYLKIKANVKERRPDDYAALISAATAGTANVVVWDGDPYELLAQARYVFTDPSTIALEAAQVGRIVHVLDMLPDHKTLYFRQVPGLCVATAEEAVRAVREIEAGQPWRAERLSDFVDLSGRPAIELVREDLSLAPQRNVSAAGWGVEKSLSARAAS